MPGEGVPVLSVTLPAYNEAGNIRSDRLERLDDSLSALGYASEVILVDDGSEDATADLLEEFAKSHPRFTVVRNPHRGKAQAVSTGVLRSAGEFVLFMDMDLATSLEHIGPFVDELRKGNADLVIASRELAGSVRRHAPLIRRVLGKGFNLIIRVLLLPGIRDTQCGFKAFRRDVARDLFSHSVVFSPTPEAVKGPRVTAFDVELLVMARRHGYRVEQMPVIWTHTKTRGVRVFRESLKMLREVLTIWLYDRRGRYKPRGEVAESRTSVPHETES
jgi:glycosyltransferase involved in cell wall biosynthesis